MPRLTIGDSTSNASINDGLINATNSPADLGVYKWRMMDSQTNMNLTAECNLLVEVSGTPSYVVTIADTRTNLWLTANGALCVKESAGPSAISRVWFWFRNLFVDERCLVLTEVFPRLFIFFNRTNVTGIKILNALGNAILQETGGSDTLLTEDGLDFLDQE